MVDIGPTSHVQCTVLTTSHSPSVPNTKTSSAVTVSVSTSSTLTWRKVTTAPGTAPYLRLWGQEGLDEDWAALSLGSQVVVPESPGDSYGGQQPGPAGG